MLTIPGALALASWKVRTLPLKVAPCTSVFVVEYAPRLRQLPKAGTVVAEVDSKHWLAVALSVSWPRVVELAAYNKEPWV